MFAANSNAPTHCVTPELKKLFPYYLLFLGVALFYSNIFDNEFIYDDKYLILQNTYLRSWHTLGQIFSSSVNSGAFRAGHFYRPLQNILYLIIYQFWGPSVFAFHLLNIVIHALNACLLYKLGDRLGFNLVGVFCGALLWTLHPIHTEAITYMSATADTLYSFFCLLGLITLLPNFTWNKCLLAIPLFILGLLSKETAIVFPALFMTMLYIRSPDRFKPKTYLPTLPFWLIAFLYLYIRFVLLPFHTDELLNVDPVSKQFGTHISLRIYTFLATLPSYFGLLIWPQGLHMDRDFLVHLSPWFSEVFIGGFIFTAAVGQILLGRGKIGHAFSFGALWFLCAYFPESGVFIPVNSLFLEHWMYLPTSGLFLGLAEGFTQICLAYQFKPELKKALFASCCFIGLIFGVLTYQQNEVWHDPIALYTNILNHGEKSVRSRNNLGVAYLDMGQYQKALDQFHMALVDYDITPETHQNIAAVLARNYDGKSHEQEEILELQKAIAIDPDFWTAYDSMANVYTTMGQFDKAATARAKMNQIRKKYLAP